MIPGNPILPLVEEFINMFERSIRLKERLAEGKTAIGAWITISSPAASEILGGVGFDWLVIDAEHAPFTLEGIERSLTALSGSKAVPIVLAPRNDEFTIGQVLDLGAEGVLVPGVRSPEEAQRAVAACKYPPEGVRGFGPRRASHYLRDADQYIETANSGVLIAIEIEHIEAIERLPQILAVPGIDLVFIEPMDLSASLGLLGKLGHPLVIEAIERGIDEAKRAGTPLCLLERDNPRIPQQLALRGCTVIRAGTDHLLLRDSASEILDLFRQHLSPAKHPQDK
jgi:2-keto-3-deoxy-L-rhamnonate aldolase RhmA